MNEKKACGVVGYIIMWTFVSVPIVVSSGGDVHDMV